MGSRNRRSPGISAKPSTRWTCPASSHQSAAARSHGHGWLAAYTGQWQVSRDRADWLPLCLMTRYLLHEPVGIGHVPVQHEVRRRQLQLHADVGGVLEVAAESAGTRG